MSTGVFMTVGDNTEKTELSYFGEVVLHIGDKAVTFDFIEFTDREGVTHWVATVDTPDGQQRRNESFKSLDDLKTFRKTLIDDFKSMGFTE
jgi:hypothetical protein